MRLQDMTLCEALRGIEAAVNGTGAKVYDAQTGPDRDYPDRDEVHTVAGVVPGVCSFHVVYALRDDEPTRIIGIRIGEGSTYCG